jgi:hypothetical protein
MQEIAKKLKITKLHNWLGECKMSAMFFGATSILTDILPQQIHR